MDIPLNVWIPWEGGECPVPKGTKGNVRLCSGDELPRPGQRLSSGQFTKTLDKWDWGPEARGFLNITAYMVTELPVEQPDYTALEIRAVSHELDARAYVGMSTGRATAAVVAPTTPAPTVERKLPPLPTPEVRPFDPFKGYVVENIVSQEQPKQPTHPLQRSTP